MAHRRQCVGLGEQYVLAWVPLEIDSDMESLFFFNCPRIEDVSNIKLIRTDTTLDLSQKAEKR